MTWDRPLFAVELPIELNNGNDGRGGKWFKSSVLRIKYEALIRNLKQVRVPLSVPVNVMLTRFLGAGQRFWDSSSWGRGNYKEIEDACVACGWFHDDGPKWIRETRFRQISQKESGRTSPATMIEVFDLSA